MPRRRGGGDGADGPRTTPPAGVPAPSSRADEVGWHQVFALLPWGIGLTDAGGRLTYTNPALVELGGGRLLLGTPWYELFEPGIEVAAVDRARAWSAAEGWAAYGRPPIAGRLRSSEGPVDAGVHVITLPGEEVGGAGGWCIACWPPAWSQGLRVAEAAVAALSHDLRTPLTTIRGLADLMLVETHAPSEPRTQRYARIIRENVEALDELIDRVVALHRFRTGHLPGRPEPVSLETLLDQLWPAYAARAGLREFKWRLARPAELPPVMGCPETVRLALAGFLASAFAAAGDAVTVTVEVGDDAVMFRARGAAVDTTAIGPAAEGARRLIFGGPPGSGAGTDDLPALGILVVAAEAVGGTVGAEDPAGEAALAMRLPRAPQPDTAG